ncbi:hypothetical protein LCGC14_2553020, partial [marine sediment metagenome]
MSEHKGDIVYNEDGTPNWTATQTRDAQGAGGTTGRGEVTGSKIVDGVEHWVYSDGSTSPKPQWAQGMGGDDTISGKTIVMGDGSIWRLSLDRNISSMMSDTPQGAPDMTATNVQTGEKVTLPPGPYQLAEGGGIVVGPGGSVSPLD